MNFIITLSPDAVAGYLDIPHAERYHFRKFIDFRLSLNPEESDDLSIEDLVEVRGVKYSFSDSEVQVYYDVNGNSVEILLIYLTKILAVFKIKKIIKGCRVSIGTKSTEAIPAFRIKRLSNTSLQEKIDASRNRFKSGEGVLLNDLPL